jgi:hypothetical protein
MRLVLHSGGGANCSRLEFTPESPSFDDVWELAKFLIRTTR